VFSRKRLLELEARRRTERVEAYKAQEEKGRVIYHPLHDLEQAADPSRTGEEVLNLYRYARAQTAAIRRSIADRIHFDFSGEPPAEGDVATVLADDIASVLGE
jgi:hypothetical protein